MYGGGYSSYGGGYGSYGSYGGYGSSYGGLSSGGYGSYGSPYGTGYNRNNQNQPDPNNPNQPPQQVNQRKQVIEQYFKMMGGLRSMVEIGFSFVALCNFTSRSWDLLKKITLFLAKTSKKMLNKLSVAFKLTDKMTQTFEKAMLLSPNSKNGKSLTNKILMAIRIITALFLLIGASLRNKIGKQVDKQKEEILQQYSQIKLKQQKIIEQGAHLHQQEYNFQKQAYF